MDKLPKLFPNVATTSPLQFPNITMYIEPVPPVTTEMEERQKQISYLDATYPREKFENINLTLDTDQIRVRKTIWASALATKKYQESKLPPYNMNNPERKRMPFQKGSGGAVYDIGNDEVFKLFAGFGTSYMSKYVKSDNGGANEILLNNYVQLVLPRLFSGTKPFMLKRRQFDRLRFNDERYRTPQTDILGQFLQARRNMIWDIGRHDTVAFGMTMRRGNGLFFNKKTINDKMTLFDVERDMCVMLDVFLSANLLLSAGVVHGDVKLENLLQYHDDFRSKHEILIVPKCQIHVMTRMIDFGYASLNTKVPKPVTDVNGPRFQAPHLDYRSATVLPIPELHHLGFLRFPTFELLPEMSSLMKYFTVSDSNYTPFSMRQIQCHIRDRMFYEFQEMASGHLFLLSRLRSLRFTVWPVARSIDDSGPNRSYFYHRYLADQHVDVVKSMQFWLNTFLVEELKDSPIYDLALAWGKFFIQLVSLRTIIHKRTYHLFLYDRYERCEGGCASSFLDQFYDSLNLDVTLPYEDFRKYIEVDIKNHRQFVAKSKKQLVKVQSDFKILTLTLLKTIRDQQLSEEWEANVKAFMLGELYLRMLMPITMHFKPHQDSTDYYDIEVDMELSTRITMREAMIFLTSFLRNEYYPQEKESVVASNVDSLSRFYASHPVKSNIDKEDVYDPNEDIESLSTEEAEKEYQNPNANIDHDFRYRQAY